MSVDQVPQFVQLFDEMFNKLDMSIADDIFSSDFKAHCPLVPVLDRAGFKNYVQGFYDAFYNLMVEINDIIPAGSRLVLRLTFKGKHTGDFLGIDASGVKVTIPAIAIFRLENGEVVESWIEMDLLGAISQIGAEGILPSGDCE